MIFNLKPLITFAMISIGTVVHAQEKETYNWEPVMNAIMLVESEGKQYAYNKNGNCAGILQITPIIVRQCNIWLKSEKKNNRYTYADRYNIEKSKEMFVMVQEHYNPSNNVEKAIRIWNGGPHYKASKTTKYYNKVLRRLKENDKKRNDNSYDNEIHEGNYKGDSLQEPTDTNNLLLGAPSERKQADEFMP